MTAPAPALPVRAIERPADAALFRWLLAEIQALHHDCIMARRRKQTSVLAVNLQVFCHRAAANFHDLARLGVTLPDGIFRHYRTEPRMLERPKVPPKYRIRPYNLSRNLLRYACLVPELLDPAAPRQEVLELSPGACAAQELLVPLGHRLHLAEFETGPGSRHGALHDELGVAPWHFDGRSRPFDLPDAMADIVLCFQAFDFYSKSADDYPALLAQTEL